MSESAPATTKSVFVISPIGSPGTPEHRRYKNTLDYVVKKAFTAPEWDVVRADEETSPDSITTQVIGRIVESDLIIADLTDHNPNVFYELAVAHGYKKPVIHMMQVGQKVPFDVVDQRVIFYDLTDPESVDKARSGLTSSAAWLTANPGQTRNPLSAYDQFSAISSASGGGEAGEAVAGAIEALGRQVARLEAQFTKRGSGFVTIPRHQDSKPVERELASLLGASAWRSSTTSEGGVSLVYEVSRKAMTAEVMNSVAALANDSGWDCSVLVDEHGDLRVELKR